MTDWLHAEYRDFDGYPRMMLCSNAVATFFFVSRFDRAMDCYVDYYEVYRIGRIAEGEVCASWFGLETRAVERLPNLAVRHFPFDVERRKFLPYDSIASLLTRTTARRG